MILLAALRYGRRVSNHSPAASDESLLLTVFGITLLVAGIAQRLEVSGAIGAFLVGLGLSGRAEERAKELISPLRDLFAAMFFLFFSFQIDPADLVSSLVPGLLLAVGTAFTKVATGWYAAGRVGAGPRGASAPARVIARGEFSIVIAALGSGWSTARNSARSSPPTCSPRRWWAHRCQVRRPRPPPASVDAPQGAVPSLRLVHPPLELVGSTALHLLCSILERRT